LQKRVFTTTLKVRIYGTTLNDSQQSNGMYLYVSAAPGRVV